MSQDLALKPFSYVQTEGFSIIELFCPLTGGAYNINHVIVLYNNGGPLVLFTDYFWCVT